MLRLPASQFYEQFAHLTEWLQPVPLKSWPPLLRTITSLQVLGVNVSVSDVSRYFSEWPDEWGAYAYDVQTLLRTLEVSDAADALAAAIALYPHGKLPATQWDRSRIASRMWDRNNRIWEPATRRYRSAKRRIPGALKRYLVENAMAFKSAFANEESIVESARSMQSLDRALALATAPARVRRGAPTQHAALVAIGERVTRLMNPRLRSHGLTRGERLFHVLWTVMDAEVQNGGLRQFFSNSSGDLAEEAKRHLQTIGALRTRRTLSRASTVFPRATVPMNHRVRNLALRRAEKNGDRSWAALEAAEREYLIAAKADLYPRLLRWVARNKAEFAGPAHS